MSCADVCIDMDYDSDENKFHWAEVRKARKAHVCCECRETIPAGARYEHVSAKSDDCVWSAKTCPTCLEIRQSLVCGSWINGQLWEEIENGVFPAWVIDGPFDCLAQIDSLEARNVLRERFKEWQADNGRRHL